MRACNSVDWKAITIFLHEMVYKSGGWSMLLQTTTRSVAKEMITSLSLVLTSEEVGRVCGALLLCHNTTAATPSGITN